MYHRVLPLQEALEYPLQSVVMPQEIFEAQIAYIAERFRVLDLAEAVEMMKKRILPSRAVVLTFDDGYRDCYDHVLPVLRKHGIPATFFIVTETVENKTMLWWDEVHKLISQILSFEDPQIILGMQKFMTSPMKEPGIGSDGSLTIQKTINFLSYLSTSERDQAIEKLRALTQSTSRSSAQLMLSWEQIAELLRAGMGVGCHTANHIFLDELDSERCFREINECLDMIKQRLGHTVRAFSYPAGRFNQMTRNYLIQAGIEAAVTTEFGQNSPQTDPILLKRISAGYTHQKYGFDPSILEMELQGWLSPFRRKNGA